MKQEKKVLLKRSKQQSHIPTVEQIDYGEIAINYKKGEEKLFIKNDNDEIVDIVKSKTYSKEEIDQKITLVWTGTQEEYDAIPVKNNNTIYCIK